MGLPDTEKDKLHDAEFDNAAKVLLLIACLFFLTILGLAYLLSKKIIRPMTQLAYWAEHLSAENLKDDIPNLKFKELDVVALQLQNAFIRLDNVLTNEKLFLNSASHELRTPIAVLTTNLAVLNAIQEEQSTTPQEAQVLARIVRAVENMKQLIQTLLWLSKEADDFPAAVNVDLDNLTLQVIEESRYLLNNKNVDVVITHKGSEAINVPEVLCKIVLMNLIRNAFQYTQNGGVKVTIADKTVEVRNVCDTDCRDLDQHTTEQSFGIGLQLVERISNKLRWEFTSTEIAGGRIVSIKF